MHSFVGQWLQNLRADLAEAMRKALRQINQMSQLAALRDDCFTLLQVWQGLVVASHSQIFLAADVGAGVPAWRAL